MWQTLEFSYLFTSTESRSLPNSFLHPPPRPHPRPVELAGSFFYLNCTGQRAVTEGLTKEVESKAALRQMQATFLPSVPSDGTRFSSVWEAK